MKKIFILDRSEEDMRLYFSSESARQDFCTKILNAAQHANLPVQNLPTFGTNPEYNDYLFAEDAIDPAFDEEDWNEYYDFK